MVNFLFSRPLSDEVTIHGGVRTKKKGIVHEGVKSYHEDNKDIMV